MPLYLQLQRCKGYFFIIAMEINIKDTTYKVKYTIRAMFVFEKITNKPFKIDTLMDWYIFFYSMILANNSDCLLTFDEFIDVCDEQPELIIEIQKYINKEMELRSSITPFKEEDRKKNQ